MPTTTTASPQLHQRLAPVTATCSAGMALVAVVTVALFGEETKSRQLEAIWGWAGSGARASCALAPV